jgi:hypothetical protein
MKKKENTGSRMGHNIKKIEKLSIAVFYSPKIFDKF